VFPAVKPEIRQKIITAHLAGLGRNLIARQLNEQGLKVSRQSVSNIINRYKKEHTSTNTQPSQLYTDINKQKLHSDANTDRLTTFPEETLAETKFKNSKDISIEDHVITNTQDFEEDGYPVSPAKGNPLSWWFVNGSEAVSNKSSQIINAPERPLTAESNNSKYTSPAITVMGSPTSTSGVGQPITTTTSKTVPKKVYPRNPIEDRFFELDRKAWEYYGHAQDNIMNQIKKEKDQRRHELSLIDRRKSKLKEWREGLEERESNLKDREARIRSFEPYLLLAKKLSEMKLTLGDALYWTQTINEVAQTKKMDIKAATVYVAQELRQYRQLGGLEKKIERANQELTLINMAAIKKQEALTVVEDLLNKGITQTQILQLIDVGTNNGNRQQPSNSNPAVPDRELSPVEENNGYGGGNFTMGDYLKLQMLKGSNTNLLSRMGIKN
jgi:hypothetical protein